MLKQLTTAFSLKMKFVAPFHYIAINNKTEVLTKAELFEIECALTDILHAIAQYKKAVNKGSCNTSQSLI